MKNGLQNSASFNVAFWRWKRIELKFIIPIFEALVKEGVSVDSPYDRGCT